MAIEPINHEAEAALNAHEAAAINKSKLGELNPTKVHVNTMEELREKAPEVYKGMLKTLLSNMIHQMDGHRDRMKRALKN